MRGGTENLLGIMGLAGAIKRLTNHQNEITTTLEDLRDYFEKSLLKVLPTCLINGSGARICQYIKYCI